MSLLLYCYAILIVVVVCNTLGCGMCFALYYYVGALMQVWYIHKLAVFSICVRYMNCVIFVLLCA